MMDMLKINLTSLKDWYREQYAPQNKKEKEDEKILQGPTGLWGWIPFIKSLRKKK